MGFSLGRLAPEILPTKAVAGWAWPRDTGLGRDMDQGVILPRGHSCWSHSAGEVTLVGVRYRSHLVEVRGQSVSLVVILAEVRWSGSHLNANGATLAQVCLCGVTDLG